jgi:ATP-binding cassette subfamily B protein
MPGRDASPDAMQIPCRVHGHRVFRCCRAPAAAARINEVLDGRPKSSTRRCLCGLNWRFIAGHVEFENVTFQHSARRNCTGCVVRARPGEVTAIVGGTGSGKSTLAGLIPRFYDVNAGACSSTASTSAT